MTSMRLPLIWLLVIFVLCGYGALRLTDHQVSIKSDMLSLLGQDSPFDQKLRESANAQQRKLLLVLSGDNQASIQQAAKNLATQLANLPQIAKAQQLPLSSELTDALLQLYQNYPFTLLNDDYSAAIAANDSAKLKALFLTSLLTPGNPFIEQTLTTDPTLALANGLMEKLSAQSHWLNDGQALYQQTTDNQQTRYLYPIFVELLPAKLGVNQAVEIAQQIEQQIDSVPSEITVLRSGLLFHIASATRQAQTEISLFSTLSTLIILAITFLVFRSIAPVVVIVLIMSIAIAIGGAGLLAMFDEIHLITFIFAISLIGISVDYGFHCLCAAALQKDPAKSLSRYLAPAMIMGAGTTVFGYLSILLMPLKSFYQITVFMIFGLTAAVLTALIWLAPFYQNRALNFSTPVLKLSQSFSAHTQPLRNIKYLIAVTVALVALWFVGNSSFNFNDHVSNLNSSNPQLLVQEGQVQQLMGFNSYPRYIVVEGVDQQAVLTTLQQLGQRLTATTRFQSLAQWIPPEKQQQQQKTALKALIDNGSLAQMSDYLEPQQWQSLTENLSHHLQPDAWPQTLHLLAQPIWQQDDHYFSVLRYFNPITAEQQQTLSSEMPQLTFIDQPTRLTGALAEARYSLSLFFILASLAFGIVLVVRYGLVQGLLSLCTPVFAALGSLLISQLFLPHLSIFNLLACLLIIALAVDYIVFFNEQGHKPHVVMAILLSSLSSAVAFGMMALSNTPAVYHFGFTTLIGILLAILISFMTPLRQRTLNEHSL